MEDNYSMFRHREARQQAWLERRPVCYHCGEHIQNSKLIDVDGVLYHKSCFLEEHEKETEDYIN